MKRKKCATRPRLYDRVEVFHKRGPDGDFGGEDIRGADGRPVYPGVTVRNPRHLSVGLGVMVPARHGRILSLYRTTSDGPILIETENGHTFRADRVVRSRAGER